MAELNDFISLIDIEEKAKNETISLPTVQRGFVWKPYQIENLWDSLLRGYPVGAFVLSKKINSEEYELLDGQQRASAICLGFYNPLNKNSHSNNKIFKTSNEKIMIFIDREKPNTDNDNRKYLFRVITSSHPWGYRKNENQKVLESKDISNAMSSYQTENYDYLKKPLKEFWPFDSYEPIPIGLFINASINNLSIENLEKSIKEWKKELNYSGTLQVIKRRNEENIKLYSVEEIFCDVKKMLAKQKIPLLLLNLSELYNDDGNTDSINPNQNKTIRKTDGSDEDSNSKVEEKNEKEQGKSEDRNVDEIENLFIRLNSGGTPLRGEELNYSILKSHIKPDLQKKIEDKCKGLFYPARFITIVFRLFNNSSDYNNANEKESISMKIKPKQFQRIMRENKKNKNKKEKEKDDFITYLDSFLDSNTIEETKRILVYNETNKIGLPTFIAYSIADKAPEIMFMLLYRIHSSSTKDNITEELKPKVLGIITLFMWLGRGEKQRDHGKLLENIWPCVKNFDAKKFWSSETVQRAMLMDGEYEILTEFPNLKNLKKIIPQGQRITELTFGKIYNTYYGKFIDKMFYNKDLILYAQREPLFEWFSEIEEYDLEDTNRAFDWDHICPNNYVSGKQNIRPALKNWYPSNGNFRAWPYSLNRGDQKDAPSVKLNPSKESIESWSKSLKNKFSTEKQLSNELLKLSACDKEWLELNNDILIKIKDDKNAKQIIYYILNRNIKICLEWYEQLKINELIPEIPKLREIKTLFESVLNKNMWSGIKDPDFDDRYRYCLSIGENNLKLYFSFNINNDTFKEDNIFFGIYDNVNSDNVLGNVKISKDEDDKYYYDDNDICSLFTLMSYSENSIIYLFKEFSLWLNEFPDKKIRDLAINKFSNSIKNKYKTSLTGTAINLLNKK